jgi:hypothetical protein
MNINSLIKNKFIIAIPIGLLLFGCLYKFNEFRNSNKEENEDVGKDENSQDIKYYLKALIICYLLGIVFVILIRKGYNYYMNNSKSNSSSQESFKQLDENNLISDDTELKSKQNTSFNKEKLIINRENELINDIKELNVDIDTSKLESIDIPIVDLKKIPKSSPISKQDTYELHTPIATPVYKNDKTLKVNTSITKDNSLENKKQMLLEKRRKLLALKNQQKKEKKIEQFQTGTPNF